MFTEKNLWVYKIMLHRINAIINKHRKNVKLSTSINYLNKLLDYETLN